MYLLAHDHLNKDSSRNGLGMNLISRTLFLWVCNIMSIECESVFRQDVPYLAITGFLFLRFFVPAILSPKLFALREEHSDQCGERTLNSKVLCVCVCVPSLPSPLIPPLSFSLLSPPHPQPTESTVGDGREGGVYETNVHLTS